MNILPLILILGGGAYLLYNHYNKYGYREGEFQVGDIIPLGRCSNTDDWVRYIVIDVEINTPIVESYYPPGEPRPLCGWPLPYRVYRNTCGGYDLVVAEDKKDPNRLYCEY